MPNTSSNTKELEAFKKELKYVKNLKSHYLKKEKILEGLTQESKKLLLAQKKYLNKKYTYKRNIRKFQRQKRGKRPYKKGYGNKNKLKKSDFIVHHYVSKIRNLLKRKRIALHCKEKELNKLPSIFPEGITSSIMTIDSKGKLLRLKFISPQNNGHHNHNILRCLSQHIANINYPRPPIGQPITILQPFNFSS